MVNIRLALGHNYHNQGRNKTEVAVKVFSSGVKPLIHQSELGTKVVPFQEKSSFHFVVL